MNHLTDETLNEYLDNELANRAEVESHLSQCADCAARLTSLQALFDEIESLPELALSKPIAAPFTRRDVGFTLPRWLKLAATLQAIVALVILVVAAPFVINLMPVFQIPSFTGVFFRLQSQWTLWFDTFSAFQLPNIPQLPAFEISSLMLALIFIVVSFLWLVGNGLLLRKQR